MAFWVLSNPGADTRKVCAAAARAAEQAAENVANISVGNVQLALRIGLHIGPVISGDFGSATRHQFTLIGPEVNKAARLEQAHSDDVIDGQLPLGDIRISPEFRRELNALATRRFCKRFVVRAKNIGLMDLYTA